MFQLFWLYSLLVCVLRSIWSSDSDASGNSEHRHTPLVGWSVSLWKFKPLDSYVPDELTVTILFSLHPNVGFYNLWWLTVGLFPKHRYPNRAHIFIVHLYSWSRKMILPINASAMFGGPSSSYMNRKYGIILTYLIISGSIIYVC